MKNRAFSSYSVALVTPFARDGGLVEAPVRALAEHLKTNGVPAFLVSGSTGEQHSMSVEERSRLYGWTVAAAGNTPVYAGAAAVRTGDAVALARAAEKAGAQGLMLGFPPYVRLTQLDALAYVGRVAEATGLPLLIYNNPLRTAFDLLPETLEKMASAHPAVKAVKEAGEPAKAAAIKKLLGAGFQVFSGSDGSIADSWAQGYDGLTSVAGNLWPREMGAVVAALEAGDPQAGALLAALQPLIQAVVAVQLPSSLKHGMRFRGLPGGWCREPLGHLDEEVQRSIEAALTTST